MLRTARDSAGLLVLVVEDEPLLGLEIVEDAAARGAHVVSAAGSRTRSRRLSCTKSPLPCSTSISVEKIARSLCQHLSQRQIPFVFYTGYSGGLLMAGQRADHHQACQRTQIVDVVERLCASHQQAA